MYRKNYTLDDMLQEAILRNICAVANFFESHYDAAEEENEAPFRQPEPQKPLPQKHPSSLKFVKAPTRKRTATVPSYLSGPLRLHAMQQSRRMIPHMQLGFGSSMGTIGKQKTKEDGFNWYGPFGKVNSVFGTVASAAEATNASFRLFRGALYGGATLANFSPRWYSSAWRGGGRAMIKTFKVSNIGKVAGWVGFGVGVIADIRGVYLHYTNPNNPNGVTLNKALLNTGVGVYAIAFCSPVGLVYYAVDAFYPGGWIGDAEHPGFFADETTFQHELNQISNAGPNNIRLIPFGAK